MLKSRADAAAGRRMVHAPHMAAALIENILIIFPPLAWASRPRRMRNSLSAREHGDVALLLDVKTENFLCQMREIADVALRERAVDRQPRDCGIADDDLFAVVAIEFCGCVGERFMVKHQHALAPAELVGQILNRLL